MDSSKFSSLFLCLFFICIVHFPQHSLSCGSCNHRKGGKPSMKPPVPIPKVPIPPVTVPKVPLPPVSGLPIPPVSGLPIPPVTVPKVPIPPVSGLPIPPVTVPKVPIPPVSGLPIPPVSGLPIPPVSRLPMPPVSGLPIPPVPKVPIPPVSGLPIPPVSGLPIPPVPIVGPIIPPGEKPPTTGGKGCPPPPGSKKRSSGSGKATCPLDTLKLGACIDLLGGLVKIGLGDPAVNKCCPLLKGLVEIEAAACLCTTLKLKALNLKRYVPVALQLLLTCGKNPPPGYTCSI